MDDVLSGEFENTAKREHRIYGLSPDSYYKQKERTNRFEAEMLSLFLFVFSLA